ncbi:hypothetical protein KDH83_30775, partial [Achromobacter sp. Marseille-Q0513]|uniref:hypothetical protein n=1 Tax=Achromobacter sp. Marseille-Q0513 TaxID=2829161 RepID=UPI001BA04BFC
APSYNQQTPPQPRPQNPKPYTTRLEAPIYIAETPQGTSKTIAAFVGALLGFAFLVTLFALRAWFTPNRA